MGTVHLRRVDESPSSRAPDRGGSLCRFLCLPSSELFASDNLRPAKTVKPVSFRRSSLIIRPNGEPLDCPGSPGDLSVVLNAQATEMPVSPGRISLLPPLSYCWVPIFDASRHLLSPHKS